MSDWLVVAIVFLVVVLAVWQAYQLQQIRKQVDAVPKDGNVFTLIDSTSGRLGRVEDGLAVVHLILPVAAAHRELVEIGEEGGLAECFH